jgi:hypothetical protein
MSNPPLFPYQQEIVDRLKALGTGRAVYDLPFGNRLGLRSADRALERATLAVDIEASGLSAVNEVKTLDLTNVEQRIAKSISRRDLQNALFGIRYGNSRISTYVHEDNALRFFGGKVDTGATPALYLRKTLMYYHVQSALMSWS